MIWAPFAKSPNWAYQITKEFGLVIEYPYSKPRTPYSLKWLFETLTLFDIDFKKVYFGTSRFWSLIKACLWEKVPLSTSCPDSLNSYPSWRRLAKARLYIVAQSSGSWLLKFLILSSYILLIVGWMLKSEGQVVIFLNNSSITFFGTPVDFPHNLGYFNSWSE